VCPVWKTADKPAYNQGMWALIVVGAAVGMFGIFYAIVSVTERRADVATAPGIAAARTLLADVTQKGTRALAGRFDGVDVVFLYATGNPEEWPWHTHVSVPLANKPTSYQRVAEAMSGGPFNDWNWEKGRLALMRNRDWPLERDQIERMLRFAVEVHRKLS
jgi:hypothetical protein